MRKPRNRKATRRVVRMGAASPRPIKAQAGAKPAKKGAAKRKFLAMNSATGKLAANSASGMLVYIEQED